MNYCEKCYRVFENEKCPNCNTKHVRKVLENDYCYLVEKDTLWAEMLKEILDKKNIPYIVSATYGAGLSIKMGIYSEKYNFYVPYIYLDKARQIIETMFRE